MPPHSTVREFIRALHERQSDTTKALDRLFTRPGRLGDHARIADFRKAGALNRPMPAWARRELQSAGLSAKQIAHVNEWPDPQKEQVRRVLVRAIDRNRSVRFFWELHGGNKELTAVPRPLPARGAISVTFRSPQSRVRAATSRAAGAQIAVDVGRKQARQRAATNPKRARAASTRRRSAPRARAKRARR